MQLCFICRGCGGVLIRSMTPLSVMRLITVVSSAHLTVDSKPCTNLQSWVTRESPVEHRCGGWWWWSVCVHCWGLVFRKSSIQLQSEVLMPRSPGLVVNLGRMIVVNANLKTTSSIFSAFRVAGLLVTDLDTLLFESGVRASACSTLVLLMPLLWLALGRPVSLLFWIQCCKLQHELHLLIHPWPVSVVWHCQWWCWRSAAQESCRC